MIKMCSGFFLKSRNILIFTVDKTLIIYLQKLCKHCLDNDYCIPYFMLAYIL